MPYELHSSAPQAEWGPDGVDGPRHLAGRDDRRHLGRGRRDDAAATTASGMDASQSALFQLAQQLLDRAAQVRSMLVFLDCSRGSIPRFLCKRLL
jgi:hypothetical protein